jgi:carbamoyltransferase
LADLRPSQSLGGFYLSTIELMGLSMFDEYKAMGLAPYGDPSVYRHLMRELYTLKECGQYEIASNGKLTQVLTAHIPAVKSSEDIQPCHRNLAASLQEALEEIVFHVLRHWRAKTGIDNLCLAGGVAHNCTMNGKILASDLFKNVFVQPAAHDAGCALGAGLFASMRRKAILPVAPLTDVYWGPEIGDAHAIEAELGRWSGWLEFYRSPDIVAEAADALAAGEVLGWVQGRSEFGPRALGNRSIIADPRPAENRARINFMIKKREGFRPFAPSVIVEAAADYFELGQVAALPFMSYVVKVRENWHAKLGAITHVDGTARVQTVSESGNARYHALIKAFGERTSVPMVLNTSFNNNVEPIVDSIYDAIVCFLTTGLDKLVIGDFVAVNRPIHLRDKLLTMSVRLARHARIVPDADSSVVASPLTKQSVKISFVTDRILNASKANPDASIGELCGVEEALWCDELRTLWEKRLVEMHPPATCRN